jgi:hypothetical protein
MNNSLGIWSSARIPEVRRSIALRMILMLVSPSCELWFADMVFSQTYTKAKTSITDILPS